MPSNSPVAIVIIGGIVLLLGLLGGGIEINQTKFTPFLIRYSEYLDSSNAVVTIHISYANDPPCYKIAYVMERNEDMGNKEFDYWLIKHGSISRC